MLGAFAAFELLFVFMMPSHPRQVTPAPQPPPFVQPVPPVPVTPAKPKITTRIPAYKPYEGIIAQINEWKAQAQGLTEVGIYGKTSRGKDLYYLRVTNLLDTKPKPKVMITACIHGNEPLATSTVMGYIGTMLATYGEDPEVTELINTRDIYFVPVVSPDSYPNSRYVDGVDPNRNFPYPGKNIQSVPPIKALQDFFLKIKPNAVISGHTFGRVYLVPYGDTVQLCPNNADFDRIVGQMQTMSKYRKQRCCEMYGRPIFGAEVDWYYRNGAFAIVTEFGTHQRIPSITDTQEEFTRTYKGTLYFIKEAPLVPIRQQVIEEAVWKQAA